MKQFIIINGKDHRIVHCENITEARHVAINTSDLSKDTVVRELTTKVYTRFDVDRMLFEYAQMNGLEFTDKALNQFSKDADDILNR